MATATPVLAPEPIVEPEGLYEIVDGQVLEKEMGVFESDLAMMLYDAIKALLANRPLGKAMVECLFLLDPTTGLKRRPDVAFISAERWPLGKRPPRRAAWDVVPDLAIEIISPNNRSRDDLRKLAEYFRAGVRLVWFVYPDTDQIYVYKSTQDIQVLAGGAILDGGDVLPGFQLALADLFGDGDEPAGA